MLKLIQFRICPLSRSIRLALAEMRMEADLAEEKPWEFREAFLAINPAGELPVLIEAEATPVCGVYAVAEYLSEQPVEDPEEDTPFALFPGGRGERAEARRVTDWFHGKLHREVTSALLREKGLRRPEQGLRTPPGYQYPARGARQPALPSELCKSSR